MINLTNEEEAVLSSIPRGKDHAIIADLIHDIAKTKKEWRTQLPTREIIRSLQLKGYAIVSKPDRGYWITDKPVDVQTYIGSLQGRISSLEQKIDVLWKTYDRLIEEGGEDPGIQSGLFPRDGKDRP